MLPNKIKLVIWDLDNTLWRGTLAEGDELFLFPERAELIKNLTQAGIVNSICSKNDFDDAKEALSRMGLWEYFVFPKINFAPKGQMVQSILDEMHLRAANTVFIDDEVSNLQEVLYYNPEITVLDQAECETFFDSFKTAGNVDSDCSRLSQYKQLERKTQEKKSFSSNEEFLRSSNIRLEFTPVDSRELFERLCVLDERTNQLNFTKKRMTPEELMGLLKNPNIETRMIHATDNFGDYGYIGFYSLYQGNLIHFVFSCRIMNMGIEHFVYQYLGYPKIKIEGDTASELSRTRQIDYIKVVNAGTEHEFDEESVENILTEESQVNIFVLGACDLYHSIAYFALPNNYFLYECNVASTSDGRRGRSVNVGTEYIRSQYDMTEEEKDFCRRHFYNYTRYNVFKSEIFDEKWDYVIISFHDDMVYKIHTNKKDPNLRVVLGTERKYEHTRIINISEEEPAKRADQRAWLAEHFDEGHYITPERFEENLLWIASKIPEKTKIILINGPEIDFFRNINPSCLEVREQIIALNKVIKRLCKTHSDRFSLVDMNKVVRSRKNVTNYLFHLKAQPAFKLFTKVADTMLKYPPPNKSCMLHKVLGERKVLVFGKNSSELKVAYYDLFLGNVKISDFVFHKIDEIDDSDFDVKDFKEYAFQSDKYYIVVAENDDYAEAREVLIKNGYEPIKDFIRFRPLAYVKSRDDLSIDI